MGAPVVLGAGEGDEGRGDPPRLTPTMSSRKLLALRFIKTYFARWGHSPTLGELSAELRVSRKRAYDLVHQLADDQMIEVMSGKTRGIRLIDRGEELSEADVLARLVQMGWTIGKDNQVIVPPLNLAFPQAPLTTKGLPEVAELDHDPSPGNDGSHESGTFAGALDASEGMHGGTSGREPGGDCARTAGGSQKAASR